METLAVTKNKRNYLRSRSCICLFVLLCVSFNSWTQNNLLGINVGMSIYGNQFLATKYQGKYAQQNGNALDLNVSYTRMFSDASKALTLHVGTTNRSKYILSDSISHALQQQFLNIEMIYQYTTIHILEDKLLLGLGSGLYWNMLLAETDQYLDSNQDKETRGAGEINNIGIMMNFPLYMQIRNNQYLCIGNQWGMDIVNSLGNSHLFNWKMYIGLNYRF